MTASSLSGYEAAAAQLIPAYEAIDAQAMFAPVWPSLPSKPSRVLDIGAGTGRDAGWFAASRHQVCAVEPVDGLRLAGQRLHQSRRIVWRQDRLPCLRAVHGRFDLVILIGVWHHLAPHQRRAAWMAIRQAMKPKARAILSLRHGPAPKDRPAYPILVSQTITMAERLGLRLERRVDVPSLQPANRAAGVTWTWLVLRHAASRTA